MIASGPGAGARNSIGIMLVSGMVVGTAFTLFVVPSIYMLIARTRVADEAGAREETAAGLVEPSVAVSRLGFTCVDGNSQRRGQWPVVSSGRELTGNRQLATGNYTQPKRALV